MSRAGAFWHAYEGALAATITSDTIPRVSIALLYAGARKTYRLVVRALIQTLWWAGYYRLTRRWLQRRTLTVVMFHRVLPADTDAYANSEREYAISIDDFEDCLVYFKRHYSVVSLAQVHSATEGGEPLPDHALLITFDDGWRDNITHATPLLEQHGLQAALFVNTDAMEQANDRWWEDALVEMHRRQPSAFREMFGHDDFFAAAVTLQGLSPDERNERLERWLEYVPGERQMLTPDELRCIGPAWEIGSHGATHIPLPQTSDLDAELTGSANKISVWAGKPVEVLAFPYGSYDSRITRRALQTYRLVLTTRPLLNRTDPAPGKVLGRINVPSRVCRNPDALGHLLCARWVRRLR